MIDTLEVLDTQRNRRIEVTPYGLELMEKRAKGRYVRIPQTPEGYIPLTQENFMQQGVISGEEEKSSRKNKSAVTQ